MEVAGYVIDAIEQFQPALVEKTAKARFAENLEPAAERAAAKKKKVAAKTGR